MSESELFGTYQAAEAYLGQSPATMPARRAFYVAVLAAAAYPSSHRVRRAGRGHHIGIPAPLIRRLLEELERTLPGAVDWTRRSDKSPRSVTLIRAARR